MLPHRRRDHLRRTDRGVPAIAEGNARHPRDADGREVERAKSVPGRRVVDPACPVNGPSLSARGRTSPSPGSRPRTASRSPSRRSREMRAGRWRADSPQRGRLARPRRRRAPARRLRRRDVDRVCRSAWGQFSLRWATPISPSGQRSLWQSGPSPASRDRDPAAIRVWPRCTATRSCLRGPRAGQPSQVKTAVAALP